MSKHDTCSPSAFGSTSDNLPRQLRGDADLAGRQPALGEIGFVGLGHMGAAMAANLVASGRRVIAYVRRPDQIARLETPGFRATDFGDLLDCKGRHQYVTGRRCRARNRVRSQRHRSRRSGCGSDARRNPSVDEHD